MKFNVTRRQFWSWLAVVLVIAVWWVPPTYRKWKADKLVDELCAKDGGVKIYETVTLSADKFDSFGEVYVPSKKRLKQGDEYYYLSETSWIIPESRTVGGLDLFRSNYKLFRIKDGKLLAEGVGYARRGGDAIGPWHPSSYGSPQSDIKYVKQKTFIRKQTGGVK